MSCVTLSRDNFTLRQPKSVDSLQALCVSKICMEYGCDGIFEAIETFQFPSLVRESIITKLSNDKSITSNIFRTLTEGGLQCLSLSAIDCAAFDENIFVDVWAIRGLRQIDIHATKIDVCMLKMFASLSIADTPTTNLVHLNISGCEDMNDLIIQIICKRCPNLDYFSVSNCQLLTELSIAFLADSVFAGGLTSLDISFNVATKPSIEALVKSCSSIQELSLEGLRIDSSFCCNFPSPVTVRKLNCGTLRALSPDDLVQMLTPHVLMSLTELSLSDSMICGDDLLALVDSCGMNFAECKSFLESKSGEDEDSDGMLLEKVDFCWCEELTSESLCVFIKAVRKHSLTHITFKSISNVDTTVVKCIAEQCHHLTDICLGRGGDISNDSLCLLATQCPLLRSVDISWSTCSDEVVKLLLEQCPCLELFYLQGCKNLTESVFDYLMHGEVIGSTLVGDVCTQQPDATSSVIRHNGIPFGSELALIDFSWVNMFSVQMAVNLSNKWSRVVVIDYYAQAHQAGVVIGDYM